MESLRQRLAVPLGSIVNNSGEENMEVKKHKFPLGKVSACLLAVVSLFVCYFPSIVLCVLNLSRPVDWSNGRTYFVTRLWVDTFLIINSTLNCLIFFYKNSVLRRRGIKIMKKYFCAKLRYRK